MEDKDKSSKKEEGVLLKKGDDVCMSCTGIAILTNAMRESGQKPLCIGVKRKLKGRIPVEKLKAHEEKQRRLPPEEIFACVGYSRTSGLMERNGRAPICLHGLNFVRYENSKLAEQASQLHDDIHTPIPAAVNTNAAADARSKTITPYALAEQVYSVLNRGATVGFNRVFRFWANSFDNFPDNLERYSHRLRESMARSPERVFRGSRKLISYFFRDGKE